MPQTSQHLAQSLVRNALEQLQHHLSTELHFTLQEVKAGQQSKPSRLLLLLWQQLQQQKRTKTQWSLV
jgi:hypothetical protein